MTIRVYAAFAYTKNNQAGATLVEALSEGEIKLVRLVLDLQTCEYAGF